MALNECQDGAGKFSCAAVGKQVRALEGDLSPPMVHYTLLHMVPMTLLCVYHYRYTVS